MNRANTNFEWGLISLVFFTFRAVSTDESAGVGRAIIFCGLPSSVGRTSWSAFFWPVELILGHYI
jgi:hypothetical protein